MHSGAWSSAKQESPRAEGPYKNGDLIPDGDMKFCIRTESEAYMANLAFAQGQSSDRYKKMWEAMKAYMADTGPNGKIIRRPYVEKMTELERTSE
jgi:hypothetical protein